MKQPRFLLFLLLSLSYSLTLAQPSRVSLSGTLRDQESGEALRYGRVSCPAQGEGATANVYGFFSLSLRPGPVCLVVRYAYFQADTLCLDLQRDTTLSIRLLPLLDQPVVEITDQVPVEERVQMSRHSLSVEQIKQMPVLFGEVDVLKAVQMLPGVQGGTEGTAGLHVRGGSQDQNLILLDGVPLYYVNHLGGFFSVFDADAIDQVTLLTGAFPARYGGRTASVLDIRMKEGHKTEFHGSSNLGLISAKTMLEGPIQKGKSSFLVSARRTYLGAVVQAVTRSNSDGDRRLGYHFYDLNAKANYQLSPNSQLFFSAYAGDDRLKLTYERERASSAVQQSSRNTNTLDWGNQLLALRWNQVWSPKLFSNLTATYTRYRYQTGFRFASTLIQGADTTNLASDATFRSGIQEWGTVGQLDFYPGPRHAIKLGGEAKYYRFSPGRSRLTLNDQTGRDTTIGSPVVPAWSVAAFVEDEWSLTTRLALQAGLRLNAYGVEDTLYPVLEPRLALRYRLGRQAALKASFSRMSQFVHLLANNDAGFPTDLWVPSTAEVPVERAWSVAAGAAGSWQDRRWEWSLEAYYRRVQGLIEYREGQQLAGSTQAWQEQIVGGGTGEMYGLEALLKKQLGATTGWVSYTLAWSLRQFADLNQGAPFPYKYDHRHSLNLYLAHTFSERFRLAATWVYQSGQAVNLPTVGYHTAIPYDEVNLYAIGQPTLVYESGRNGFRFRPYHRLDVSMVFTKKKPKYTRSWIWGVYNAYGRRNPYFYFFDRLGSRPRLMQFSLFPVIPSVTLRYEY